MTAAYHDGRFLALEECCISPLDRGFLFGDGVYEVMPVYRGRVFRYQAHVERLAYGLAQTGIKNPYPPARWRGVCDGLIERSGLSDLAIYVQVTRGVAPRDHVASEAVEPTVFAMTLPRPEAAPDARGVRAITAEDTRWGRCDVKSVSLLANVLLRRRAREHNAHEAILLRDGTLTEGAASNVFVVSDGNLATPPLGPHLLAGITRGVVIEIAAAHGVVCEQRAIAARELLTATEVWLTSSTREILPVTTIDDQAVGCGAPGPRWREFSRRLAEWRE